MNNIENKWPAWLDVTQGLTGLILVLFMWGHMFMVSSILISKDAMYWVSKMFEGEPIFGRPYPIIVSMVALFVLTVMVIHAGVAMRKFPSSYQSHKKLKQHMVRINHGDTWLWLIQAITGFMLFFLASIHLYQMLMHPGDIGPYASSDRVWSERVWPLYLFLLFAVELHAGVGIYRLAIKWGWFDRYISRNRRVVLKRIKWAMSIFFIVLGLLTLGAYMQIGYEHQDNSGERYVPSYLSTSQQQ